MDCTHPRWRTTFSGVVSVLTVLAMAGTAQAALPGANGKITFQSNQDGDYEVFTVDSAGGSLAKLTNNTTFTDGDPAWSPDGSTIAFATNRDGNYEIYTMSATGSNLQRLTTNSSTDGQPSWSPTGAQITFASDRDGNFEIYKMDANGSNQLRLTTNAVEDSYPAWSPDGTKIAFQRGPTFEVYKMNTDGSSPVNLSNNAANDTAPNWDPDGSQLAFVSTRTGGGDIYSMNADGTNQALFKGDAASDNSPAYSPRGDLVAWARYTGATYDLFSGSASFVNTGSSLYASTGHDEAPDWQPLNNSYARPKGASPLRLPLVPAYKECSTPNTTHLSFNQPACYGPKPESSWLTVGTPDYNGAAANSTGFVRISAFCNGGAPGDTPPCLAAAGDQLDGKIELSLSDVRCKGVSGGCTGALADYTGQLWFFSYFRLTDKYNGPTGVGPSANATTTGLTVDFGVPCLATGSTTIGSTCSITTSIDAVLGSSTAIAEQKRGIWELAGGLDRTIRLYDGGSDGVYGIGDTLFATAGLFFP
jgi:WD40 repeat protein